MKLKVCGMRNPENIKDLIKVSPDYVGFIFYDRSPRHVGDDFDENIFNDFPSNIKKVGVFVNAPLALIVEKVKKYKLDLVQLHGEELPDFCKNLQSKGVNVIKAFSVDNNFIFSQLNNYKQYCDYFLFDAKGEQKGGNGILFDWKILQKYDNDKPLFLAGGISLDTIKEALEIKNVKIHAIDINSKFELSPGMKDIEAISSLKKLMSNENEPILI
ncbi:MAG: phosphoribosylanthranilate isomerase [Pseudarcicella sp.]|nr:phosphoribosylanthranilate isomerase [Pseudarcicella sp.]MBP6410860.1 phosphoribosylanthranilate isomerase [Pseudarcicella sp.]